MSFEAPVQPVLGPRHSSRPSLVIAAGAFAVAALLVWRPWVGGGSGTAAGSPQPVALVTSGQIQTPSNTPSPAPSSVLYANPPSANSFAPIWSVVGVRDLLSGVSVIDQFPVEPRAAARTGPVASAACDLGPAPDVGFLPAVKFRLVGVVAPHASQGWIRLSVIDGSIPRAFAVLVTYPPGTEDLAVGLFGMTALSLWPRGGYAFYAVDDTGIGRYLYACLRI